MKKTQTQTNDIGALILELHKQYPNDAEFGYFARIEILAWYNLNKQD
jgi:hypothetical protein